MLYILCGALQLNTKPSELLCLAHACDNPGLTWRTVLQQQGGRTSSAVRTWSMINVQTCSEAQCAMRACMHTWEGRRRAGMTSSRWRTHCCSFSRAACRGRGTKGTTRASLCVRRKWLRVLTCCAGTPTRLSDRCDRSRLRLCLLLHDRAHFYACVCRTALGRARNFHRNVSGMRRM